MQCLSNLECSEANEKIARCLKCIPGVYEKNCKMLKVYTGCIGLLIEEHCIANDIIGPEQAGAKKEMWG